ncbi:phage portal protein [Tepidibacter mesophilus]|uniref:phage portal protein n=1 Tax=Tepidibacter mesophilus TaxID=655607 RepID=UPI000C0691FE|nr:phage portal protein [Tepidibacter mesophilus]
MNIVMSYDNNNEIKVFPVVPDELGYEQPQNNEEFETVNAGILNLIGDMGLRTLSISSMFPTHDYKWLKVGSSSDGQSYVDFIEKIQRLKVPARIVVTYANGVEFLNMACTVESFNPRLMKNEDIKYDLNLKEYTFTKVGV